MWTALIVMGLAALALRQAWIVLSFGVSQSLATPDSADERLQGFVALPIVGGLARRDILRLTPASDAVSRVDDLTGFLAAQPLASGAWLDLSVARLAARAGLDEVAQSLALSNLTGPNEAYLMAARTTFGLPLWATLPSESRRSVMTDIVGGWAAIDEANRIDLKTNLASADGKTREEVRAALLLSGKTGVEIEKTLALTPPATSTDDTSSSRIQPQPALTGARPQGAPSPSPVAPPLAAVPPATQPLRDGIAR